MRCAAASGQRRRRRGRAGPCAVAAAGGGLRSLRKSSTSRRTTRPPGPEPRDLARSTLAAAAIFRASGLALTRPPAAGRSRRLDRPLPVSAAGWPLPDAGRRRLPSPPPRRPAPRPRRRLGRRPSAACAAARPSPGRPRQAGRDLLGVLVLLGQDHHPLAQRDFVAGGVVDVHDRAVVVRLHRHGGLVGLDVGQHVSFLDLVADLDQPLGDHAGLHRGAELRHRDFDRHVGSPWGGSVRSQ